LRQSFAPKTKKGPNAQKENRNLKDKKPRTSGVI